MNFKQIFNFKQRIAELINVFKNIKSFDFLGRLTNILKDIPGLVALAGATLIFVGSFLPYATFLGESLGMCMSYNFGWLIFILSMAMLGLAYFKQIFWAGLTSALCFTITFIQGLILLSYRYIHGGVGFWFVIIGELAVIGAFALHYFVFNKNEAAPAIEAKAAPVAEAPATETPAEASVVEAPANEEASATSDAE